MANGTEELDKYINGLANIPDDNDPNAIVTNDDAGDEDVSDNGNADANFSDAGETPQDQSAVNDGTGTQPKDGSKKDKQPDKSAKAAKTDELRPLGDGTFANAKGDIVSQDGKLIASGGFAARMHQTNKRLKAQLTEQNTQLSAVMQQVGEVRSLAQSIQRAGLDNNEVAQAMDMASRLKRGDHLGVAKEVIAMIAAQGYNVTDLLGSEVGDSIELKAINRMIDERLAPITRQEQDRKRQQDAEVVGRNNYNKFVSENEYADVHANDIVQVMNKERVTPQQAYNRLMQFASINRLDFSQPLAPQIQSRMKQQSVGGQQPKQNAARPMPNGGATRTGGAVPSIPLASADDDWGTIISQVQKSIGGH